MTTDYAGRTILEDHEIVPGSPATHYIGGDAYSEEITEVVRYKTGSRKGQIKELRLRKENCLPAWDVYRPAVDEQGRTHYLYVSEGKKVWWSRLVVGYAYDYRDPSF